MGFREHLKGGIAIVAPAMMGLGAVLWLGGATALAQSAQSSPASSTPSAQEFLNAATDTANWILPNKSYSGNRYTDATEIGPANVGQLHPVWKDTLDDIGPMETVPIVYNGTMYVTTAHDHVYALDAATGKVKWEFKINPHVISFAANRGVGLMDGNVYIGTLDGHLIALNAETGDVVWNKVTVADTANSFYSMAPVPYTNPKTGQNMILEGVSNGDWGGMGNLTAYNPKDGSVIWTWETIPDSVHNTWGGDSWKRGGASVWGGVTIDPSTQTAYVNVGNPSPDFNASMRAGDNLYSDSIVALDISGATPTVKWYHQFIKQDTHDWDPVGQPLLTDAKIGNATVKVVATGDKAGNFWILDAATGKLLDHTVASFQKGQDTQPDLTGNYACPNTNGGFEYQGMAFDPATNAFLAPTENQCGFWRAEKDVVYVGNMFYLGGAFPKLVGPNTGQMNAINASNGIFDWRHHFRYPAYGGALATASGLVFTSTLAGEEIAFDTKTGNMLWSYDLGSYTTTPTVAYEMNGQEYIVATAGNAANNGIPELPAVQKPTIVEAFSLK